MEDLSYLAQTSPNIWICILLSFLGMLLYWGVEIKRAVTKKKESFDIKVWFNLNWIDIGLSVIASLLIFIGSWAIDALTMERCVFIGGTASLLVNKLLKL